MTDALPDPNIKINQRQRLLIDAGLALAEHHGFDRVSRAMVAERTGVSEALISYYWTASIYQTEIMRAAIDARNLPVIAQGLAARHEVALGAPAWLQQAAAASLVRLP